MEKRSAYAWLAVGVLAAAAPMAAVAQEVKPGVPVPPDAPAVARAVEKGKEMLEHARWKNAEASRLAFVAGDRVFVVKGQGGRDARQTLAVLDAGTGKQVGGDMAFDPRLPIAPGERVADAGEGEGTELQMLVESEVSRADTARVTLYSGVDKRRKWELEKAAYRRLPAFAGTHVVTGAALFPVLRGGSMGGRIADPPMVTMAVEGFERATGKPEWSWALPAGMRETTVPVAAGGRVFFSMMHGTDGRVVDFGLVGLDAGKGKEVWPAVRMPTMMSGPGVGGGMVVVTTGAGECVALDAATGKEAWKAAISPGTETHMTRILTPEMDTMQVSFLVAPAVDDQRAYVSVSGLTEPALTPTRNQRENLVGGMAAFELKTGKQVWFSRGMGLPANAATNPMPESNDLQYTNVQVWGNHVVAMVNLWRMAPRPLPAGVVSLDARTGEMEWFVPMPATTGTNWMVEGPVVAGGVVYLRIPPARDGVAGALYAVELE